MIGFAVVFGLLAVFIARMWLDNQANLRAHHEIAPKKLATQTIVVAAQPLRFGAELKAAMLKEIEWPATTLPAGAFPKIADLLGKGRRLVLSPVEPNEPVLAVKVTGAGERATLSALVRPGMKAVTVRVNDVEGVGGFVMPGDHVDVVLTRTIDKGSATAEVVLQTTRVLAVDQSADQRASKAAVPKSVTLEVDTLDAQKIWLASSVGSLSLLLRKAGETAEIETRKISLKDLHSKGSTTTITVTRASTKQEYSVPAESRTENADAKDTAKDQGLAARAEAAR
jgi:pilus assembly protein CpaB